MKHMYFYKKTENNSQRRPFLICPKLQITWLPFRWWLGAKHQLYDIRAIKPYKLNSLWLEYRCDCERFNLDHEAKENFGLWG